LTEGRVFKRIKGKFKEWNEKSKRMEDAKVEALAEHLKHLGLDATVIAFHGKKPRIKSSYQDSVLGAVRIANQHIDLVELAKYVDSSGPEYYVGPDYYRCHYIVRVIVDGLEVRFRAKLKPVRKGFLRREIVGFKWEGGELARMLSGDASLGDKLHKISDRGLLNLEIEPYTKPECVRIRPKSGTEYLASAFPTLEAFELFDIIAQHVRRIATFQS
jgi:hypothetical protein